MKGGGQGGKGIEAGAGNAWQARPASQTGWQRWFGGGPGKALPKLPPPDAVALDSGASEVLGKLASTARRAARRALVAAAFTPSFWQARPVANKEGVATVIAVAPRCARRKGTRGDVGRWVARGRRRRLWPRRSFKADAAAAKAAKAEPEPEAEPEVEPEAEGEADGRPSQRSIRI
jgi:hypothetical protein